MENRKKNLAALNSTGSDPTRFDVFCFNSRCSTVVDGKGKQAKPRMNYMGCEHPFLFRFWRRAHVYSCSICGAEHWFKRNFRGSRWITMWRGWG